MWRILHLESNYIEMVIISLGDGVNFLTFTVYCYRGDARNFVNSDSSTRHDMTDECTPQNVRSRLQQQGWRRALDAGITATAKRAFFSFRAPSHGILHS